MKKMLTFALALGLILLCGACAHTTQVPSSELPLLSLEEISQWPDNKYTNAVPQPEAGTVFQATVYDDAAGYYSVSLSGTRSQGEDYLDLLKKNGFKPLYQNSNDVSIGALFEKDNVSVSVAVSDGSFGIFIRLYE